MTTRDTMLITLTYVLIFVLVVGIVCVVCTYVTWFRGSCRTAERRSFIETMGHGVSVPDQGSNESDMLLGGEYV